MNKTKVKQITKEFTEGQHTLIGLEVETHDDKFIVPVIDVRVNENYRAAANGVLKNSNAQKGSKHLKPTYSLIGRSYQASQKK